jgi:hypothetical protein
MIGTAPTTPIPRRLSRTRVSWSSWTRPGAVRTYWHGRAGKPNDFTLKRPRHHVGVSPCCASCGFPSPSTRFRAACYHRRLPSPPLVAPIDPRAHRRDLRITTVAALTKGGTTASPPKGRPAINCVGSGTPRAGFADRVPEPTPQAHKGPLESHNPGELARKDHGDCPTAQPLSGRGSFVWSGNEKERASGA